MGSKGKKKMAFPREATRLPVRIGRIDIVLTDHDPLANETQSSSYRVEVYYNDGTQVVRQGNLTPELTANQKTSLAAFLTAIRTKANNEILG